MSDPLRHDDDPSGQDASPPGGLIERLRAHDETTPEETPAEIASGGMGLMLAVGLIMGAGIGAILGNYLLDDAFGWGVDFLVGGVIGLVIGGLIGYLIVTMMTRRLS